MTIKVIGIGKTDKVAVQQLVADYEKRLKRYVRFELQFLPDVKKSKNLSEQEQANQEAKLLLSSIKPTDVLVLLDETGKEFSSVGFASFIQKKMNASVKCLVFAIGGPYGFHPSVLDRSQGLLSLSKMTFSHQMVRAIFLEQLYRAFTILKNEPYHHQ